MNHNKEAGMDLISFSATVDILGTPRTVTFDPDFRMVIEGLQIEDVYQILGVLRDPTIQAKTEEPIPPLPEEVEEVEEPDPDDEGIPEPPEPIPVAKKRGRPRKAPEPEVSVEVPVEEPPGETAPAEPPEWVKACRGLAAMVDHLMKVEKLTDHEEILARMDEIRLLDPRMRKLDVLNDPEIFRNKVMRGIEVCEKELEAARG